MIHNAMLCCVSSYNFTTLPLGRQRHSPCTATLARARARATPSPTVDHRCKAPCLNLHLLQSTPRPASLHILRANGSGVTFPGRYVAVRDLVVPLLGSEPRRSCATQSCVCAVNRVLGAAL